MRKSCYSDRQNPSILKADAAGSPVPDICRKHGYSDASFYTWRSKFGGMDVSYRTPNV